MFCRPICPSSFAMANMDSYPDTGQNLNKNGYIIIWIIHQIFIFYDKLNSVVGYPRIFYIHYINL